MVVYWAFSWVGETDDAKAVRLGSVMVDVKETLSAGE